MFKILIVDSGDLDRDMTRGVLSEGLGGPVALMMARDSESAHVIMEQNEVDLLIADVPLTTAYVESLVHTAYSLQRNINVILTSVRRREEIAHLTSKLNATGYLLKPFRREKILELVRPLEEKYREEQIKAGVQSSGND